MVTHEKAKAGAAAAKAMLSVSRPTKDAALKLAAERLTDSSAAVFDANRADVEAARAAGAPDPVLARLGYGPKKLEESVAMLAAVAALPDPSGIVLEARRLDSGLTLRRVSCPIGLIALIFESRPDALVQMAALAAKSGDAIIVKGGREAERTNRVLAAIVARAGVDAGLPDGWLGQLETVLGHANGVCHVYVHGDADLGMAARVAVDSKAQYPAACNAAETLLVDASIAGRALPRLASALEAAGVTLDLCPRSDAILGPGAGRRAKCDDDWSVEYLEPRMAVRVVDSLGEAVSHINRYGSGHTDAIVCSSAEAARRFMDEVDSASVFHNASTRFADGYRYGLGAEVGISTGKLHARGPMGMDGLLTYKWKLEGAGQIVADYASGAKKFEHADIDAEKGTRYGER